MIICMMVAAFLFISPVHAMDDLRATPPRIQKQKIKIIKRAPLPIHAMGTRTQAEYNLFVGHMKASPQRIDNVTKQLEENPDPVPQEYIQFIKSNYDNYSSDEIFYQFSIDEISRDVRVLSLMNDTVIYRKINHISLRTPSV